jgi:hypothetical protein
VGPDTCALHMTHHVVDNTVYSGIRSRILALYIMGCAFSCSLLWFFVSLRFFGSLLSPSVIELACSIDKPSYNTLSAVVYVIIVIMLAGDCRC